MAQPLVWMLDDEWDDHSQEERYFSQIGWRFLVSTSRTMKEDYRLEGRQADALIQQVGVRLPASLFEGMPNLKIVCVPGVGYDHVHVESASRRGIWVSNIPDYCTDEVADHTVAALMYFHRDLRGMDEDVRKGIWDPLRYVKNRRTAETMVGLVGFGRIGRRVAAKLAALGFRVAAFDRTVGDGMFREMGVTRLSLEMLMEKCDYVSLHLPATPETEGMLDAELLGRMPSHGVLINTSRGSVVDEAALAALLMRGKIRGAALDVFQVEPLPADHVLRRLPNVLLSPHAAYVTRESIDELKQKVCREVTLAVEGHKPVYALNRPQGSHRA